MSSTLKQDSVLNGICPYFTMFPLDFPYEILRIHGKIGDFILDPFCGRGTTNFAARILGYSSFGIDSSPVAVAISIAKLVDASPEEILAEALEILNQESQPENVPVGEFWEYAFHPEVLVQLCKFREAFLDDCKSKTRKALRGIILGALHGPKPKTKDSYFSNQAQRTYAPKPNYAVNYWKKHELIPNNIDVLSLIREKAERYYSNDLPTPYGNIILSDSRNPKLLKDKDLQFDWVITSPPYYGMKTYLPDQWLRLWFLGNKPEVDYSMDGQVIHSSPEDFSNDLLTVWNNIYPKCKEDAKLVIRFGGINDRKANPIDIIISSLARTQWKIEKIVSAGTASEGKRQAIHIKSGIKSPREEYDIWASKR
ncbi:MAG: DNA methyltransferase [Bacteroidota bacterium]